MLAAMDVLEQQSVWRPCAARRSGPGLDLTKLVIISGKQCWVVYVDVLLLAIEANVVDTVSLAVKVYGAQGAAATACHNGSPYTHASNLAACWLRIILQPTDK